MKKVFVFFVLYFAFSSPLPAATGPRVDGVRTIYDSELRFSFYVSGAFKKDLEDAVNSGMPTSFTYKVKLYRKKNMWFDEQLGSWKFNHTVKYDALKQEYQVSIEEKNLVETTKDFDTAKAMMATGNDVIISPIPALKKGEFYEIKLMAELDVVRIPSVFKYLFFFVKLWDFETDWYSHRFTI
ncbi:MAG: DUF4390 domain-containing protein [Thermodesulfobacteriota bacterium]